MTNGVPYDTQHKIIWFNFYFLLTLSCAMKILQTLLPTHKHTQLDRVFDGMSRPVGVPTKIIQTWTLPHTWTANLENNFFFSNPKRNTRTGHIPHCTEPTLKQRSSVFCVVFISYAKQAMRIGNLLCWCLFHWICMFLFFFLSRTNAKTLDTHQVYFVQRCFLYNERVR